MLARGLTAAAVTEWLEASPKQALRTLAGFGLRDGVDGDVLIGAVESTTPDPMQKDPAKMKANPVVLEPSFEHGAAPGHLGAMAQELLVFIKNEYDIPPPSFILSYEIPPVGLGGLRSHFEPPSAPPRHSRDQGPCRQRRAAALVA